MLDGEPGWGVKLRIWIERDGRKVLGPGRVELLELIDQHRSISAAAKHMNMSYRRAWSLVRDMNEAAQKPLVELATGGTGGGGAELTAAGVKAVRDYQRLVKQLSHSATKHAGIEVRV